MDLRKLKDKATEAFSKGKFAKAGEAYAEYCAADPRDLQARLRMGDAWSKCGQKDKAIIAYSSAAEGFAKEGFLPRAIAASKLILELDPAHKGVQKMLADLYARKTSAPSSSRRPSPVNQLTLKVDSKVETPGTAPGFEQRSDALDLETPSAVMRKSAAPAAVVPSPMNRADAIDLPPDDSPMAGAEAGVEIEVEEEAPNARAPLADAGIELDVSVTGTAMPGSSQGVEVEVPIAGEEVRTVSGEFELDVSVDAAPSAPRPPAASSEPKVYSLEDEAPPAPVAAPPPPPAPAGRPAEPKVYSLDDEEPAAPAPVVSPAAAPVAAAVAATHAELPAQARPLPPPPAAAPAAEPKVYSLDEEPERPAGVPVEPPPAARAAAPQVYSLDDEEPAAPAPVVSAAAAPAAAAVAATHAEPPADARPLPPPPAPEPKVYSLDDEPELPAEPGPVALDPAAAVAPAAALASAALAVEIDEEALAAELGFGDGPAPPRPPPSAPPGLKPRKSAPVPPAATTPAVAPPAPAPEKPAAPASRIWLPSTFSAPEGGGEQRAVSSAAPAAPSAAPAPVPQTDLERSLAAFATFDTDAPAAPPKVPAPPARPPSFTELELEGDSLLHAVETAAEVGLSQRGQQAMSPIGVEERMEAPEEARPEAGALPKIPLFSDLPEDAFIALFERCPLRRCEPGEVVIAQGSLGDSFFVICSGSARVFRMDGQTRRDIALLEEGAFFGEMALLSGAPRTASVEAAAEDTQMLEISAPLLAELSHKYPPVAQALKKFCRQRLLTNVMNTSNLFAPFSRQDRRTLVEKFRAREVNKGEVLIKEGQRSDGMYVILSGEVEVRVGASRVAALKEGDLFGEMSLLTKAPATATCASSKRTSLLRLPREDFDHLILSHPQILVLVSELTDERNKQNAALASRASTTSATPMV